MPKFINGVPMPTFIHPFDNDVENMKETKNLFLEEDKLTNTILQLIEDNITQYKINSINNLFGKVKNFYEYVNFIIALEKYYDIQVCQHRIVIVCQVDI